MNRATPNTLLLLVAAVLPLLSISWADAQDTVDGSQTTAESRKELSQLKATPITEIEVPRLIDLDREFSMRLPAEVRQERPVTLRLLGRCATPAALEYLRSVFESESYWRHETAYALSLSALDRPANSQDWRYLVRSLTVVEGEHAVSVLQALARFRLRATKPVWLRRVVLLGLRLKKSEKKYAVELFEKWTRRRFAGSSSEALAKCQEWFRTTYPDEPDPVLPQDPPQRRWKYRSVLTALSDLELPATSEDRGRVVFEKANCQKCHRKGAVGERWGPDLTTLGWRRQAKEILEATLYPSHELNEDYTSVIVVTRQGKTISGLMAAGTDQSIVIVDSQGQQHQLRLSDIKETKNTRTSNMPGDLLEPLTLQEIRDLFAFLASTANTERPHRQSLPQ